VPVAKHLGLFPDGNGDQKGMKLDLQFADAASMHPFSH
jgi:hypothetical protein